MKQLMILIACLTYLLPGVATASDPFYKENTAYQWITQKYRFTHHLDFRLLPGVKSGMGGSSSMRARSRCTPRWARR